MAERRRVPMVFGQGLDRETGQMAVEPGSMETLQNVYIRRGKLVVRKGTEKKLQFVDVNDDPHTHVLAGHMLLGERTGVVVAFQGGEGAAQEGDVDIYLIDSSATEQRRLGNWFNTNDQDLPLEPPTVHIATSYGRAFFAHDELAFFKRAPTFVYDPYTATGLGPIRGNFEDRKAIWERIDSGDFDDELLNDVKFRGVVSHRHYLFGWGYGTESEDRAEIVRVSRPGEPTKFDPEDYFKIGSERDPTISCISLGDDLMAFKETETYRIFGHSRKTFGHELIDERFGCLGPRLAVSVAGNGFVWSTEGPRLTQGGPTQELAIPLELEGPEPEELAAMIEEPGLGWANYIPEERVVVFAFNRRLYVLSVRQEPWEWSYWNLGFDQQCGFQLYDTGIGGASLVTPIGYPSFERDDYDVEDRGTNELWPIWRNVDPQGGERVEIWYRRGNNLVNFWRMEDDGDGDGVVDGFSSDTDSGITADFTVPEVSMQSADDTFDQIGVQRVEITDAANAGHAWVEQTFPEGSIEEGEDYDIAVKILQDDLVGTAEAQVHGRWMDDEDTELDTFTKTLAETTPGDDGYVRRFVPTQTAPADAVKLEIQLRMSALAAGDTGRTDFALLSVVPASSWGSWNQNVVDVDLQDTFQDTRLAVSLADGLGVYYQLAMRYTNSGLAFASGYESDDPTDWPDVSRGAGAISSAPESLEIKCGFWRRGTIGGEVVGINDLLVKMTRETYDRIVSYNAAQAFQEAGIRLFRKDSSTGGDFVCVRDDNPEDLFGAEPTLENQNWSAPCDETLVGGEAWARVADVETDDVPEEEVEYAVAPYFGVSSDPTDPFPPTSHCQDAFEVGALSGPFSKWTGPRKPENLAVSSTSSTEYRAEWTNEYDTAWDTVWDSRDVVLETEVHVQINGGGFSLETTVEYTDDPDDPTNSRATGLSATSGDDVDVKVRHKVTSFGRTDFSDFTETFSITMP
ncbi:MAG: hypothetical protein ACOC42_01840 [Halobacteriota archaeon]